MILLDTHAALWFLFAADRLGPETRMAMSSASRVYFSAVSVAETSIKRLIGRLEIPDDLPGLLARQGLTSLPLTPEHASAIERFPELARHDPFDRLLLAQAAVEGCRLVTADRRLLHPGLPWVLAAGS